MELFTVSIFIVGLVTFTLVWMPLVSKKTGVSYPLFYFLGGILLYSFFPAVLPDPLPQDNEMAALRLTELIVIISLMGAGIRIDRVFSFRTWRLPLRLVFIAMPLCIAIAAALGYFILDFNLAAAVLLGAVLAPTDPVLATDVQVGPPNGQIESEHKFTLTSEAGINDGMAFPFTWLAITIALISAGDETSFLHWFSFHVIYQIVAGIVLGYLFGKGVGYLVFDVSKRYKFLKALDGFLAIALTFLVYGLTELLHGYGFVAVFVAAITLRHYEKEHEFHTTLHSFTDQIEKLFVAVLMILFGGAVARGLLEHLTWPLALFAIGFLLVIRPVLAYMSLMGTDIQKKEKLGISFFGIRGMGSLFYLAFAFGETEFESEESLWSVVAFTIALSITVHGLAATPTMSYLRRKLPKPKA
ncbi:cation:proton antiporter [Algoriphagus terrigena]|uniref:cation:proton antiporter n=1 Tax=Algoriphagus terrigena TaxID=344884 RepID=UPI000409FFD1|nr:sodium:proton antiporter [Algoriphagus terrigena]